MKIVKSSFLFNHVFFLILVKYSNTKLQKYFLELELPLQISSKEGHMCFQNGFQVGESTPTTSRASSVLRQEPSYDDIGPSVIEICQVIIILFIIFSCR